MAGRTKKLVLLALMVSQALVLSIVESWIPIPVSIPGIKLGLANIISVVVIMFFGWKEALLVVFLRVTLASLFAGGPTLFLFSMSGGILSALLMSFLYYKMSKALSITGISIAGAIMHNIGQLAMAALTMKELSVMAYLPVLLISGIIMGCFVGLCTNFLAKALKNTRIFFS